MTSALGPQGRRRVSGVLLGLTAASMFASQSVTSKLALNEGADPFMVAASRCLLGAIVLWIHARLIMRLSVPDRKTMLWMILLGASVFGSEAILVAEALARLPAGTVVLIIYSYPAMLFLFALSLQTERATIAGVVAVVASFAGVALVVHNPTDELDGIGVALALGAALGTAFMAIGAERLVARVPLTVLSASVLTGATAALVLVGSLSGDLLEVPPGDAVAWMVLQGTLLLPLGIWAYVNAISLIGASKTAIADTFGPVVALGLSAALLGDRPTAGQIGGTTLVIAAIIVLILSGTGTPIRSDRTATPDSIAPDETQGGYKEPFQ